MGHWDASGFPNRRTAEVFLSRAGRKEKFGTVSWDAEFIVADYGGPAKAIEAWPVNLGFKKALNYVRGLGRSALDRSW